MDSKNHADEENGRNLCDNPAVFYGAADVIAHLLEQLDDDDAIVRQNAAHRLGDLGHQAAEAVGIFRNRLLSADVSYHDRACAAWALSQIVRHGDEEIIADLFHVFRTAKETPQADDLRLYCAFAIDSLAADAETVQAVKELCASDPFWRCQIRAGFEAEPDPEDELRRLSESMKYPSPFDD